MQKQVQDEIIYSNYLLYIWAKVLISMAWDWQTPAMSSSDSSELIVSWLDSLNSILLCLFFYLDLSPFGQSSLSPFGQSSLSPTVSSSNIVLQSSMYLSIWDVAIGLILRMSGRSGGFVGVDALIGLKEWVLELLILLAPLNGLLAGLEGLGGSDSGFTVLPLVLGGFWHEIWVGS